jgi:hypothetical protein
MVSRRQFGKLVGGVGIILLSPLGKAGVLKNQTKIHYVFLSDSELPRWELEQGQRCIILIGNPWLGCYTDTGIEHIRRKLNINIDGDMLPSEKDIIPGTTISSFSLLSSSSEEIMVPMFPNWNNSPQHNKQLALCAQGVFERTFGDEAKDIIVANKEKFSTHIVGVVAFG